MPSLTNIEFPEPTRADLLQALDLQSYGSSQDTDEYSHLFQPVLTRVSQRKRASTIAAPSRHILSSSIWTCKDSVSQEHLTDASASQRSLGTLRLPVIDNGLAVSTAGDVALSAAAPVPKLLLIHGIACDARPHEVQSYLEAFLHTSLLPGAIVRDVDITLIRSHGTISILFWDARMAESAQQVLNRDAAVDGIRADLISHHRVQSNPEISLAHGIHEDYIRVCIVPKARLAPPQVNFVSSHLVEGLFRCGVLAWFRVLYNPWVIEAEYFDVRHAELARRRLNSLSIGVLLHLVQLYVQDAAVPLAGHGAVALHWRPRFSTACRVKPPPRSPLDLNLYRMRVGLDSRTTVMIRNIPNRMACRQLLSYINEVTPKSVDFIYLRVDYARKLNVAYAFVNFSSLQELLKFVDARLGRPWDCCKSPKHVQISYARLQGNWDLVSHFRNSPVMKEKKAWRPKLFYSSGYRKGLERPFPGPTKAYLKTNRLAAL